MERWKMERSESNLDFSTVHEQKMDRIRFDRKIMKMFRLKHHKKVRPKCYERYRPKLFMLFRSIFFRILRSNLKSIRTNTIKSFGQNSDVSVESKKIGQKAIKSFGRI